MAPSNANGEDVDDLDDLDDVLEEFTAPAKEPEQTATQTTQETAATPLLASRDGAKDPGDPGELDATFEADLAKEMEAFIAQMGGGPPPASGAAQTAAGDLPPGFPDLSALGLDGPGGDGEMSDEALRKMFEQMLSGSGMPDFASLMANDIPPPLSASSSGSVAAATGAEKGKARQANAPKAPQDFQETIRQTMEKLKGSSDSVKADLDATSNDPMAALLAQMSGSGSEEELQAAIESMMGQLMSKDLLYEPLKELSTKYPQWLRDNESKIEASEVQRYRAQQEVVDEIVRSYESPKFNDDDEAQQKHIVELMSKMQESGAPPTELMGEMPPGMNLDNLPSDMENCTIM
ncbi:uncharacterized protein L969DRAFT_88261 [Mixia osmundae IAM 14324]|uniref:Uncharacterized protein n=1 Tax=Mixia osmundae (strain CBS 9802 / IAM 14324 / JCM 22182 / KY 12970) TaxID=764103 RepID=G7E7D6_MIXOS|nr:uncharacterized protein L969DRAFT_88261 [Mixia osmundae IAM 14324]KEI38905.1 hypothetical protein L969DRAFT_88261 [Mixia osmundae IAM 14324]GAA98746.1 hypothetical protein E5Q_05434 [Mixia osmundae IAM 14324]